MYICTDSAKYKTSFLPSVRHIVPIISFPRFSSRRQKAISGQSPSPIPWNPPSGFSYLVYDTSSQRGGCSQLPATFRTPAPVFLCPLISHLPSLSFLGNPFPSSPLLWARLCSEEAFFSTCGTWFGATWVIPDPHTSPGWVGSGLESRLNDTQKGTKTPQLWGQSCEGVQGRLCSLLTWVPVLTTRCETWSQSLRLL